MQSVTEPAVAVCSKGQQQEPTCLELAQHTLEELQLMARPLKATMAALTEHGGSNDAGEGHLLQDYVRLCEVVLRALGPAGTANTLAKCTSGAMMSVRAVCTF
jgi:hypothetical protein